MMLESAVAVGVELPLKRKNGKLAQYSQFQAIVAFHWTLSIRSLCRCSHSSPAAISLHFCLPNEVNCSLKGHTVHMLCLSIRNWLASVAPLKREWRCPGSLVPPLGGWPPPPGWEKLTKIIKLFEIIPSSHISLDAYFTAEFKANNSFWDISFLPKGVAKKRKTQMHGVP